MRASHAIVGIALVGLILGSIPAAAFAAFAALLVAALEWLDDAERRDARRRNQARPWRGR